MHSLLLLRALLSLQSFSGISSSFLTQASNSWAPGMIGQVTRPKLERTLENQSCANTAAKCGLSNPSSDLVLIMSVFTTPQWPSATLGIKPRVLSEASEPCVICYFFFSLPPAQHSLPSFLSKLHRPFALPGAWYTLPCLWSFCSFSPDVSFLVPTVDLPHGVPVLSGFL